LFLFSDGGGFNVNFLSANERDAISDPRISSIIFNTTDSCLQIFLGYWESIWCTPMGCLYPSVVVAPLDQDFEAGDDRDFTITAYGSKIYYKWQESRDGGVTWQMLSEGGSSPQYIGVQTDSLHISDLPSGFHGYQYRCHISNACGTELSAVATLSLFCGQPFTDIRDNKSYSTTYIGSQCWMAENLNVGTMINSSDGGQLQTNNGVIEKYCYDNNLTYCETYGGLYEWNEMMQFNPSDDGDPGTTQGICPEGWHLPTLSEYNTLVSALGGENSAGGKMKETGTTNWNSPNSGATNSSGFTGLPSGYRSYSDGTFTSEGSSCYLKSATQVSGGTWLAYYRKLSYSNNDAYENGSDKNNGNTVRCVKTN